MSRREEELEEEINSLQNYIKSNQINPNDKTKTFGILEARKSELEKIIEYREGLDADGITKGKKTRNTF